MDKSKFKSIYELINLPSKKHLTSLNEHLFQKTQPSASQISDVTPNITKNRNQLIDDIQKELIIYENVNYPFKFPLSKFPQVASNESNNISYQKKIQYEDEDTFADRLSPSQIDQIKVNGEFEVKSSNLNASIPYVWKINQCLFKGQKGRVQVWQNGLAWCYEFFNHAVEFFVQTIPDSCKKLGMIPVKFFALIFGRKKLASIYTPNYEREVFKDFWQNIMKSQLSNIQDEFSHEFLKKLYIKYELIVYQNIDSKDVDRILEQNKKKQILDQKQKQVDKIKNFIKGIENQFQQNWRKIRKNILAKLNNQIQQQHEKSMMIGEADDEPLSSKASSSSNKKDDIILERLHEEKYLVYIAHLKQNLPKQIPDPKVVEQLLNLVTIFNLISSKIYKKNNKLSELDKKIRQKIKQDYSIRSRNYSFVQKTFNTIYEPQKSRIEAQFYDSLTSNDNIGGFLNEKYKSIYLKYVNLIRNFDKLVQDKKKLKSYYKPQRVFESSYILFPPYQINNVDGYFYVKKQQVNKVDTSTHFWKCMLYGMRLKCWTLNCIKILIGLSWAGPLGLRNLRGSEDLVYDEACNLRTGQKQQIKRKTLIGHFKQVLVGVYQSRQAFQALPDLGLFGKNCSRICNLIQCYIFRFFIVGVIGVIMLYPVAIVLFSLLCILGVLTIWIWVPLAMLICYLFNILVFQFQIGFYTSGCLIRGIPLLSLAALILFHVFKILASVLFLFIIAPLICVLYFFLLILQRILRTISDLIMICLIRCLGRTPSRDTAIARKISGPGMSRSYFYSIAQQDVYVLTQSHLQKILVNKFIEITREQIRSNTKKYQNICNYVFKPFGISRPSLSHNKDFIYTNVNKLQQHFNVLSNNYLRRYPNNPYNVRFTQQQIETYFENSVKIVKNFVQKQRLQQWIFDQHNLLHEDYDQLTRYFWMQIFNCGQEIFQPLEKIDSRFKLVDDTDSNSAKMKKNVSSVVRALQGEVQLSHKRVNINPIKRSLLDKDRSIGNIMNICSTHDSNSSININVNLNDPSCLFVAHRNINSLKKYDEYQKQQSLKNQQKIIQQ